MRQELFSDNSRPERRATRNHKGTSATQDSRASGVSPSTESFETDINLVEDHDGPEPYQFKLLASTPVIPTARAQRQHKWKPNELKDHRSIC